VLLCRLCGLCVPCAGMRLDDLNALDEEAAARELRRCCGSSRWAQQMTAARPFATFAATLHAADATWSALHRADWLEAFAAHPKIGAGGAGKAGEADTARWSAEEQAGVAGAAAATRQRLGEANREYVARFGYIFIICAAGKSAGELLEMLERRLRNDADREIQIAAEEQRKIMRLRLAKLLETDEDIHT
jgi:2-oxo-4-hydroxy-4-carboxy-5-ureidoimidazoline decarboxylase